jgi:hypothetical protein
MSLADVRMLLTGALPFHLRESQVEAASGDSAKGASLRIILLIHQALSVGVGARCQTMLVLPCGLVPLAHGATENQLSSLGGCRLQEGGLSIWVTPARSAVLPTTNTLHAPKKMFQARASSPLITQPWSALAGPGFAGLPWPQNWEPKIGCKILANRSAVY